MPTTPRRIRFALLLLPLLPVPLSAQGFRHDYDAAKAQAQREGKDLLLLFTGSDWCPPCKRLHAEVLGKPAFQTAAAEDFILVELDFPRRKQLPADLRQQNEALKTRLGASAFPSVFLLEANGRPYHLEAGYRGAEVEAYLRRLQAARAAAKAWRGRLAATRELAGKARAQGLDRLLREVPRELLRHHEDLIQEALRLDPELPSLGERLARRRPATRRQASEASGKPGWTVDASAEIQDCLRRLSMHSGGRGTPPAPDSEVYQQVVFDLLKARYKMGHWPRGAMGNRALIALCNWADHQRDAALFKRCVEDLRVVRQNLGGNEKFMAFFAARHKQLKAGTAKGGFMEAFMGRRR